jgi:tetratricopeptide (TPR) repeat protein
LGNWESGLAKLDALIEEYPLEQDLRTLKREMVLRSRIDLEEQKYQKRQWQKSILKSAGWIALAGILIAIAYWGISNYASWIESQFNSVRQTFETQVQDFELTVKYRDAQSYLQAGNADTAIALLEEIAGEDPNFPGLQESLSQAESIAELNAKYAQAKLFINQGDNEQALETLNEIKAADPFFEDVPILINQIETKIFLKERFDKAEDAYHARDWESAATQYGILRTLDPSYERDFVEERLFNSYINAAQDVLNTDSDSDLLTALNTAEDYYNKALQLQPQNKEILAKQEEARNSITLRLYRSNMNAAQTVIAEQPDSLEALATAETYFNRALILRPDDPSALRERELVRAFTQAQRSFLERDWDEVIDNLEYVYEEEPEYGNGAARQTLYDAYMARGDAYYASGEYEISLEDYRTAAVIAEETPDAVLSLIEAKLKIAETLGVLGNYESAVTIYKEATGISELIEYIEEEDPTLAANLKEADRYAELRYFRTSYRLYRDNLSGGKLLYGLISHVVKYGEYLPLIALRYNTTVKAILQANGIVDPELAEGQEIVIPVLPSRELEK